MQKAAQQMFEDDMKKRLAKKPWIAEHCASETLVSQCTRCSFLSLVIPDFPINCRRLTPGSSYLEALCEDNVRTRSPPYSGS